MITTLFILDQTLLKKYTKVHFCFEPWLHDGQLKRAFEKNILYASRISVILFIYRVFILGVLCYWNFFRSDEIKRQINILVFQPSPFPFELDGFSGPRLLHFHPQSHFLQVLWWPLEVGKNRWKTLRNIFFLLSMKEHTKCTYFQHQFHMFDFISVIYSWTQQSENIKIKEDCSC